MSKQKIAITAAFLAIFITAVPVYAQNTTPDNNQGLFGSIESFFGGLFHHQKGATQRENAGFQNQNVTPGQAMPSGMMLQPSGMPDYQSMQKHRLSMLVQQGKITQTQADAILAELTTVQTELKNWADSQGINESYVLGGPMGGFREEGNQQEGSGSNNQSQGTQQFKMHSFGQGQGGQQGFQQGGQRPQQSGGQDFPQSGEGGPNQEGQ